METDSPVKLTAIDIGFRGRPDIEPRCARSGSCREKTQTPVQHKIQTEHLANMLKSEPN